MSNNNQVRPKLKDKSDFFPSNAAHATEQMLFFMQNLADNHGGLLLDIYCLSGTYRDFFILTKTVFRIEQTLQCGGSLFTAFKSVIFSDCDTSNLAFLLYVKGHKHPDIFNGEQLHAVANFHMDNLQEIKECYRQAQNAIRCACMERGFYNGKIGKDNITNLLDETLPPLQEFASANGETTFKDAIKNAILSFKEKAVKIEAV